MPWYMTEYDVTRSPSFMADMKGIGRPFSRDGVPQEQDLYGAYLWAPSLRAAKSTAKRRGIDERILGECRCRDKKPSDLFRSRRRVPVSTLMHSLSWLSFLALKSGAASVDDLLGDAGVVHQAVHCLEHAGGDVVKPSWVYEGLRRIERKIPGFTSDRKRRTVAIRA